MNVKVTKSLLMTALITGSVMLGSGAAFAAESVGEFELDPMIVTAQRSVHNDLETPKSVDVITQKEMIESGATQVYDALKLKTGLTAYGYGTNGQAWGGMTPKVLIRGNDKGTLVMIDGAPINMNNCYYVSTLPVEAVERVEIVKGASSVLYGSEASGGVINIITKNNMKNSITLSKGEYGKTREGISLGLGKLGVVANLEQGDELKGLASNGRSMNDGKKASVLWKYKFDDKWTVSHQHTENDYNFNQYDTKTWSVMSEDSHYKYKEDFVRLKFNDNGWNANLYYNRSDRENDTLKIKNGVKSKYKIEDVIFSTIGLDVQKEINTKFADVIIGTTIEKQKYELDNPYVEGNLVNQVLDKDAKNYAVFAQLTKDFGNGYTATLGAREQYFKANDNYNAFTPEFSLLKKIDDQNSVYINASKAFKMPNFTALYGSGAAQFVPNPNLKPEEGWTYELGYKHISDTSSFKTALYYIDMDAWSYITINGDKDKPVNAPFENLGLELSYDKELTEHFSYALGADFSNPKENPVDKNGKSQGWKRKYARQQYTTSLKYKNGDFNASLVGSLTADRAGGWKNKLPLNLYLGYKVDKNSRFDLVCENLLDREDYVGNWTSAKSTKYLSLPRNIRLTYTYTF